MKEGEVFSDYKGWKIYILSINGYSPIDRGSDKPQVW